MSTLADTPETVRRELLPLVERMRALAHEEGDARQASFFSQIERGLSAAREPDDLADPFMALSTSAFLGFSFSVEVGLLLDRVLEIAQSLSTTLTAPGTEPN